MNTCIANSTASFAVSCEGCDRTGVSTLRREQELNRFFAEVERRALRIAEIGVRDRDEAMDLVQDAMIRLARKYADKDVAEWTPLFYRILQNGVRDWHRRQAVRKRVMAWFGRSNRDDEEYDAIAAAPDPAGRSPEEELQLAEAMLSLEAVLQHCRDVSARPSCCGPLKGWMLPERQLRWDAAKEASKLIIPAQCIHCAKPWESICNE